jgi:hypothetical protein
MRVEHVLVGELVPQGLVAVHDLRRDADGLHGGVEQPARLEVEQLTGDVGAGQVEVVVALADGQRVVQLAGLGVDEVRRKGAGVAAEQGVGQRAVAPVEAGVVQAHEQHRQRIDQPVGRVGAKGLGEQRAVGQRELQVARDQRGIERPTSGVDAAEHDPDRLHAGHVQSLELAQQAVLAAGEGLAHLLDRVDRALEAHEAHHVAGDATW